MRATLISYKNLTMPDSKIDRELNRLVIRLNNSQKRELIRFTREMLGLESIDTTQTIDEYNLEIDRAIKNVEQGNFTTFEDLEKEMKSWKQVG